MTPTEPTRDHRAQEQQEATTGRQGHEASRLERAASLLGGIALTMAGLSRRNPIGAAVALAGSYVAYRGATRQPPMMESLRLGKFTRKMNKSLKLHRAITISRPVSELYNYWQTLENLPAFMQHLESVTSTGDRRSHWVARMPAEGGMRLEWDAETTEIVENELISWRSLPGGDIKNSGSVRFKEAPGNRGTELHLTIEYDPPDGILGAATAHLLEEVTAETIQNELRRFKQLMEVGEIATTEGQPSGREKMEEGVITDYQEVGPRLKPDPDDVVTEASWESFPASDAPGWTSSHAGGH